LFWFVLGWDAKELRTELTRGILVGMLMMETSGELPRRYGISRRHRLARSSLAMNDVLRL
jgi:hypothetical protein